MLDINRVATRRNLMIAAGLVVVGLALFLVFSAILRTEDREEWVKTMHSQISKVGDDLDDLDARTKSLPFEARDAAQRVLDSLKEQRHALVASVNIGRMKTGRAWRTFKKGTERSWREFSEGARKAKGQLTGRKP